MAMVWGLIFVGFVAGYGLWNDVSGDLVPRQSLADGGVIEVPRGPDGHFHLTVEMNGTPVRFIVDTGASDIVLTQRDAERIGIDTGRLVYSGLANTANGVVATAFTEVKQVSLGPVSLRDVGVSVNGGEMEGSLLGMAFLNRFERIEIAGGRLRLEP